MLPIPKILYPKRWKNSLSTLHKQSSNANNLQLDNKSHTHTYVHMIHAHMYICAIPILLNLISMDLLIIKYKYYKV